MRTAQRGSNPITWSLPIERHQGLVELARCRSDLFSASSSSRRARKLVVGSYSGRSGFDAQVVRIKRLSARHHRPQDPGVPFDKLRTGLLASATTAFCQPERSRSETTHVEILSCRRCAVMTADFAPWISSVRR